MAKFDISVRDSQGTHVEPINVKDCGLLVYRRMRADGVFYDKCKDYKDSLQLQLGALKMSMQYKADVADFLEPWYGIGYIASALG